MISWWAREDSNLQPSGYEPPSRSFRAITRRCDSLHFPPISFAFMCSARILALRLATLNNTAFVATALPRTTAWHAKLLPIGH